jgi:Holliday junction resolvase
MKQGGGRAKGAAFEREIARLIEAETGVRLRRNLTQYQQRGLCDLVPADDCAWPWAVECKRYAEARPGMAEAWYRQACDAAQAMRRLPALIYKSDRRPITVRVPLVALIIMGGAGVACPWKRCADVNFYDFCYITRELLAVEMGGGSV